MAGLLVTKRPFKVLLHMNATKVMNCGEQRKECAHRTKSGVEEMSYVQVNSCSFLRGSRSCADRY